jgi:hypothetical protein
MKQKCVYRRRLMARLCERSGHGHATRITYETKVCLQKTKDGATLRTIWTCTSILYIDIQTSGANFSVDGSDYGNETIPKGIRVERRGTSKADC